jgi:hypothetical protein
MNAALANHWFAREFFRGLAKKPKVGTLSGRLVNGCTGMRERRGADIASSSEAPTNVFNGRAVGHEQHAVFFESGYSLFECEAIRSRPVRCVKSNYVSTCHRACPRMAQCRGDVDAFVAFLPKTDDGNLYAALDGRDV